jgi:hypothetical protein
MKEKCIYREYCLVAMSTATGDGRFQSRAAVMILSGSRTHSQRFMDFTVFSSEEEADDFAIKGGKAWVDAELQMPPGGSPTNFAAL